MSLITWISSMRPLLPSWTSWSSCLSSTARRNPSFNPHPALSTSPSTSSTSINAYWSRDLSGSRWRMRTQDDHNKFSKRWRYPAWRWRTCKSIVRHSTGWSTTLRNQCRIRALSSDDPYTHGRYSPNFRDPTSTCTKSLSSCMSSIMMAVSTPFTQR